MAIEHQVLDVEDLRVGLLPNRSQHLSQMRLVVHRQRHVAQEVVSPDVARLDVTDERTEVTDETEQAADHPR